jgi:hypothetical protein
MKQIVIGDIHGQSDWKKILEMHPDYDQVIFVGDYLDSFNVPPVEQLNNLKEIAALKKNPADNSVILMIGNHDHHYLPGVPGGNTSGYQPWMRPSFEQVFQENPGIFQAAYVDVNGYVYSHAGITETWCERNLIDGTNIEVIVNNINNLMYYQPRKFLFYDGDRSGYGDHILQSPIWVRPQSLDRDAIKHTQIVGHTIQQAIQPAKSTRRGYWLIDTMQTTKEFLVIIDGYINVDRIPKEKKEVGYEFEK